jgi:N-acylneuraminate cytidylyltransferase
MRQEFKIDDYLYDENGSVYIFTQKLFMEKKNRLGGKIGYEIFPEEFGRQVDTYLDLEVLKATANYINMKGQDE